MRYIDVTWNGEVQFDMEKMEYILWDEVYSDEIGRYPTIKEALTAYEEYGNSLG